MATNAKYKVYNSGTSQWEEYKFSAYDSEKLGGKLPSYYLNYNNLTNKPTIPTVPSYATQAQAEAGTSTTGIMSPLRVKQAIDKFAAPNVFFDESTTGGKVPYPPAFSENCILTSDGWVEDWQPVLLDLRATQAEAEAGTNNTKLMSPLRVKQAIDKFAAPIGDYALRSELPTIPSITVSNGAAETGKYIKSISASGHTITVVKDTLPSGGGGAPSIFKGSSSSSATTTSKVATLDDSSYTPKSGDLLSIIFTKAHTASSATLNVNSKGAKTIVVNGTNANSTNFKFNSNTIVTFYYDGLEYHVINIYQVTPSAVRPTKTLLGTRSSAGVLSINPALTTYDEIYVEIDVASGDENSSSDPYLLAVSTATCPTSRFYYTEKDPIFDGGWERREGMVMHIPVSPLSTTSGTVFIHQNNTAGTSLNIMRNGTFSGFSIAIYGIKY